MAIALTIFVFTLMLNAEGGDLQFIVFLVICITVPLLIGQWLALQGVRESSGCLVAVFIITFGIIMTAALENVSEDLAILTVMFCFFSPTAIFTGLWSLNAGRAMWSLWLPLMLIVGCIVMTVNESPETLAKWKSGAKWQIWDTLNLSGFVGTTLLIIYFLVARERQRLFRWRTGPLTTLPAGKDDPDKLKLSLSAQSWLLTTLFAVFLSLGVAFISPYLWQTEIRQGEGELTEPTVVEAEQEEKPVDCDNYQGCTPPPECWGEEEDTGGDSGSNPFSQEELKEQINTIFNFLWLAFITLLLILASYFVFSRPLRRVLLVRHYREPLWPISTTQRIENHWKLIQIALKDIDIKHGDSSSAVTTIEDILPKLKEITGSERDIPGLMEAAEIRDRIRFGLNIGPQDAEKMKESANWVYDSVWNRLGNKRQIKALFRKT